MRDRSLDARAAIALPAIATLALICRLYPVLHGGGLKGLDGYDDGVYYSAADAVLSGRVPYRDFVLLHPPGLIYLLTPFAALGRVVGDPTGWATARVAMMLVGATSAVVVFLILRRFGWVGAVIGGLLYAVWPPAINGETSTLLECVPNLLLLLALFVLGSPRLAVRPAAQLAAGAALGLGMSIKIWGLVPLLVVVGWQLISAGRRRGLTVVAGAVVATVVVCGPTFVLAPGRMWEFVVADQFARSGVNTSLLLRLETFTPVQRLLPGATSAESVAAVVGVVAIALLAAAFAWQFVSARVFVVLLVAQSLVLCASPPYFTHYTAFTAPAAALTAGAGSQGFVDFLGARQPRLRRLTIAVLVIAVAFTATPSFTHAIYTRFDGGQVSRVLAGRHCVVADSPAVLILANVLTRDLDRRCPTQIDVSGVTYNLDEVLGSNGRMMPRVRNGLWQKELTAYLLSGQAAIVARSRDDALDPASKRALRRLSLLYRGPSVSVYGH